MLGHLNLDIVSDLQKIRPFEAAEYNKIPKWKFITSAGLIFSPAVCGFSIKMVVSECNGDTQP